MKIDYSFLFIMLGGISMIVGWVLYYLFDVVFIESMKFVILGIALILFSFTFIERHDFQEVNNNA